VSISLLLACCYQRARGGTAVSTVGFELEQVRQYLREHDSADGYLDLASAVLGVALLPVVFVLHVLGASVK
jgi:hypothetical protein